MNDDELLARLRAADPALHVDEASSWTDELVEAVMDDRTQPADSRRTWMLAGAVAAAVLAVGGGTYVALGGAGDDDQKGPAPAIARTLELDLPAQDAMQMCMQFSVDVLRPMEVAFSGTATEVEGESVRIETDHWYKGGDAEVVTLEAPSADVLLEGGITFAEGERYLVTATGGTVSSCGFSGPWTAEMAAAYDEAF